jgi:hypothetical protein
MTTALLALVTACGGQPAAAPTAAPAAQAATAASPATGQGPVLRTLYPDAIVVGEAFNAQPDGRSALAVRAENAGAASAIVFNGTTLPTEHNPGNILTAFVPTELVSKPGEIQVWVTDGGAESNKMTFTVKPR